VDDQYGTRRQIAVAEEQCYCPVEVTLLDGVQHAPQRESPDRVAQVIAEFAKRTLA